MNGVSLEEMADRLDRQKQRDTLKRQHAVKVVAEALQRAGKRE